MYEFLKQEKSPRLLVEAVKFIGVKEKIGPENNPVILQWAKDLKLDKIYTKDEIPWCGLFAAKCAFDAGLEIPKSPLWALSWAKFGNHVDEPMLGDILTFTRNGGGHVGIYVGENETCYHVLGGNQSDMVSVTRIKKDRLHEARRTAWKIAQPKNVRKILLDSHGTISKNEK